MCGILGYVGTGFSVSRFAGALRLLAHRGPFGEGIAALPNGAIGMTRLPMSGAAAVPLPPQEGQRRVAYNGEVYQAGCEIHGEIRLLLDGLQRGVLPDGMYALASWDPQTRQLTLLRDEFGIKPLYYSYQPERGLLAFASEPRALLHLLGGARADAEAIAQVVAAGVPLEGQTLFQQVRLLLPGEVLRFDLSQEVRASASASGWPPPRPARRTASTSSSAKPSNAAARPSAPAPCWSAAGSIPTCSAATWTRSCNASTCAWKATRKACCHTLGCNASSCARKPSCRCCVARSATSAGRHGCPAC